MEGHPNMDTDNINNPHDNYKDIIVTPWEVLGDLEEKT